MPSAALRHKPVLLHEAIALLALVPGATVVDGTLGAGGHASALLNAIGPAGRLIALDQDGDAVAEGLEKWGRCAQVSIHRENFRNIPLILQCLNVPAVHAVILDIGISSEQLDSDARGFSFERSGPLDMRMDTRQCRTAADVIREFSQSELEKLFEAYGEERWAKRYARAICEEKKGIRIETTNHLARVIEEATPGYRPASKSKGTVFWRRHPATRVFQALRIEVNDELRTLEESLPGCWDCLMPGGRMAVITFHSLEDRIVKNFFREMKQNGRALLVTRKPTVPQEEELRENTRSRSAKLRVAEKIA